MITLRTRPVPAVTLVALVAATGPPAAANLAPPGGDRPGAPNGSPARELRSLYTNEHGIDRPDGVTFDPRRDTLVVAGPDGAGGTKLVEVTPAEDRLRTMARPNLDGGGNLAFDPRRDQLSTGRPEVLPQVADARGATFSPDGTQFVLDARSAGIVSVRPDGTVTQSPIEGLEDADLAGLAYNPADERLYVAESDGSRLYALDESGEVVQSHDLADAEIADLQAMTFAPSADHTDDEATQSLYVADAGDGDTLGRVAEVTTAEAVEPMVDVDATLVATRDLSALDPPSTDSAGAAYLPDEGRLMVTDSEVNEMPFYEGVNMFTLERDGTFVAGGTTVGWSNEPTGTAYDPATGSLFTSDDDGRRIYRIAGPGSDGVFGTDDDGARTDFRSTTFDNNDPEGVAFDTQRGHLLVVDGVGSEVYRLDPGADGVFQGVGAGSDDVASHFDMSIHGAEDPEGIEYDEERDTIAVLDGSSEAIYEVDANGSLLNVVSVQAADAVNAAGLAIAPASDGSGSRHYYLVDRGLDNNSHPDAVDGMMYEVSADLGEITNLPPSVDAGPDRMADVEEAVTLVGSAVDDGNPGPELTYQWSRISGPGTVTFGTPGQATTTATFSAAGTHVLRLTADDSALTGFDEVTVTVYEAGSARTVSVQVETGTDDAQQGGGAAGDFVDTASADIELGNDGATPPREMLVGIRFNHVPVPAGGEVTSARIQFTVDELGSEDADYTIRGQAADNAPTFVHGGGGDISSRSMGTQEVEWSPPAWSTVGAAGPDQQTPELGAIVQEVVDRPGWQQGNAVAFTIEGVPGTGRRTAEAKEGGRPPVLQLEYRMAAGSGAECGDVAADICTAMWEHREQLESSDQRALGEQVAPARTVGEGAMMELAGGTIYWSPRHGPHAVWGAILGSYERLGGPGSFLGFPATDEQAAGGSGRVSRFTKGRIYWSRGTGAHEVHGAVLGKYLRKGGPGSFLGFPVIDERAGGVPGSRLSRFTGGRILWSKATGAHEVHGAIERRFAARGGARVLGLPTTDERRDGLVRYSRFQRAHIYWSRSTGPRAVYGAIRARYLRMGGHLSVLGLPVREEYDVPGGRRAVFEQGAIYWNRRPSYTVVTLD